MFKRSMIKAFILKSVFSQVYFLFFFVGFSFVLAISNISASSIDGGRNNAEEPLVCAQEKENSFIFFRILNADFNSNFRSDGYQNLTNWFVSFPNKIKTYRCHQGIFFEYTNETIKEEFPVQNIILPTWASSQLSTQSNPNSLTYARAVLNLGIALNIFVNNTGCELNSLSLKVFQLEDETNLDPIYNEVIESKTNSSDLQSIKRINLSFMNEPGVSTKKSVGSSTNLATVKQPNDKFTLFDNYKLHFKFKNNFSEQELFWTFANLIDTKQNKLNSKSSLSEKTPFNMLFGVGTSMENRGILDILLSEGRTINLKIPPFCTIKTIKESDDLPLYFNPTQ